MASRIRTRSSLGSSYAGFRKTVYQTMTWNDCSELIKTESTATDLSSPSSSEETFTDWVTERYHERISKGSIVNKPMSKVKVVTKPPVPTPYECILFASATCDGSSVPNAIDFDQGYDTSGSRLFSEQALGSYLVGDYGVSARESVVDRAVAQTLENATSTEWAVALVAAEAGKTVSSIQSILTRLYRIVRMLWKLKLSQRDVSYLKKQLTARELEDRYMEIRYAIRPLVYDVKQAIDAYNAFAAKAPTRRTFRGSASSDDNGSDTFLGTDGLFKFTVVRDRMYSVSARGGVLCAIDTSAISILGLDQMLETGWELFPFSFIIDWFVDVGSLIGSWTPNAGVTHLASWVTVKQFTSYANYVSDIDVNDRVTYDSPLTSVSWSGKKSQLIEQTSRSVGLNPSFGPSVHVNLNTFKILDLLIILKRIFI